MQESYLQQQLRLNQGDRQKQIYRKPCKQLQFNQIITRLMQKNIASYFKSSKKGEDQNDQVKEQQFIEENLKKEKLIAELKVPSTKSKQLNPEVKGAVLFMDMAELYEQVGEIKGQNSKDAIKELVAKLFIRIMKENREEFHFEIGT
ncbi:unnamed protein product (macronuclear) [Paramecium tetraurelia]|uniref:Uncharacterized protein n=1 Tax=Paramecium tetraurelia TaxID=5888 RepID=A0EGE1_PARTE|nr:uncharacterized protein GSPATT00026706001 [Paramecium tetraurelia]CAK94382.1 unnamed protein product [Paramecium tetraurelia]|eukprot:XP_001461755.1 hypothetical protein (macronuclear) [Paramecium tetraurelia strain d4-2]